MAAVSIIIATHNRRELLLRAIGSIQAQTFDDWELIVVDDGSTDGTGEALQQILEPRLVCVTQRNMGRSAARNHGLDRCSGEFVTFLDDDDRYLPDKLRQQAEALRQTPEVDLVACGMRLQDEAGTFQCDVEPWLQNPVPEFESLVYGCPMTPGTIMVRRSALERHRLRFASDLHYAEDTEFILRLLAKGSRATWVPEVLICYRRDAQRGAWVNFAPAMNLPKVLDRVLEQAAPEMLAQLDTGHLLASARVYGAIQALALNMEAFAIRALGSAHQILDEQGPDALSRLATIIARSVSVYPEPDQLTLLNAAFGALDYAEDCFAQEYEGAIEHLRQLREGAASTSLKAPR